MQIYSECVNYATNHASASAKEEEKVDNILDSLFVKVLVVYPKLIHFANQRMLDESSGAQVRSIGFEGAIAKGRILFNNHDPDVNMVPIETLHDPQLAALNVQGPQVNVCYTAKFQILAEVAAID